MLESFFGVKELRKKVWYIWLFWDLKKIIMKQPQQFYQQKRKPTYKLNQMLRGAQGNKTKKHNKTNLWKDQSLSFNSFWIIYFNGIIKLTIKTKTKKLKTSTTKTSHLHGLKVHCRVSSVALMGCKTNRSLDNK